MFSRSEICLGIVIWLTLFTSLVTAQPGIRELPIVEKPRERATSERVFIRTKPTLPSKGVLAVVLTPVINGQVVIKDAAGKILERREAGENGQAEFQLQRGRVYQIEAAFPGYLSAESKSKPLQATEIIRLRLVPQFATLKLPDLPAKAQVFIDNELRATNQQAGAVTIADLKPGNHALLIRHHEYNDYTDTLKDLEPGTEVKYARIPLRRVAKLTVEGPAGATVLIDGAVQARIEPAGKVSFDYELDRAMERTISIELLGYQTWTRRETFSPGPRTITAKLDPIITSAGVSDFFDTMIQWSAPASWKILSDPRNKRLEVSGSSIGTLKDKTYRNCHVNFVIWLSDGKGATWAVRADKEGRNYYLFHLAGPSSTTHTPNRFYTYLVKDGAEPVEVSTPIPLVDALNPKTSYTIDLTVQGSTVKHTITSNETGNTNDLGIWTDTSTTKDRFLYGTFGFRSMLGETFIVDDFNLEPIAEQ